MGIFLHEEQIAIQFPKAKTAINIEFRWTDDPAEMPEVGFFDIDAGDIHLVRSLGNEIYQFDRIEPIKKFDSELNLISSKLARVRLRRKWFTILSRDTILEGLRVPDPRLRIIS